MDDLRELATTLRGRGISLVIDLVLNHVAREHEWAERARAGDAGVPRLLPRLTPTAPQPDAYESTMPEVFPDFAPGSFTLDDELDAWVWTTFNSWQWDLDWANPGGARRVRRHRPAPGQHRGGGAAPRRDRLPVEAAGHQLPEPARGARRHPGAAHRRPDRRAGADLQGRGDRRAARPGAVPRHRPARRPGQRPRLPQQPDGAGLVDARHRRRTSLARHALAALPPDAHHRHLDHLRPLPRRHRLGHRRQRRRVGGGHRSGPPALPGRLVRRRVPRLVGRRPGLPAQPRDRRPADQRHAPPRSPGWTGRPPTGGPWPGCSWPTPWWPAGAACP